MKPICVSIVVTTLFVAGEAPAATRRPMQRVVRATAVVPPASASGLVVLPFAVPVAVPVSVVSQPAVLYSYRDYATPRSDAPAANAPAPGEASPATPPADAAVALLTSRCAKCHTGAAPQGHLQLFDDAGQILPKLPRRAIVEMVSPDVVGRQQMPPGELPKLTAEERATIAEWAQPPRELAY
jgi:uncharacterized membrane protein